MGFLNKLFSKSVAPLMRLPHGSFTMDRHGRLVVTTLPSSFPPTLVDEIGQLVLQSFREAQSIQLPLAELNVHFGSLKLCARELRGGAIVFLSPTTPITSNSTS